MLDFLICCTFCSFRPLAEPKGPVDAESASAALRALIVGTVLLCAVGVPYVLYVLSVPCIGFMHVPFSLLCLSPCLHVDDCLAVLLRGEVLQEPYVRVILDSLVYANAREMFATYFTDAMLEVSVGCVSAHCDGILCLFTSWSTCSLQVNCVGI